jgi:uncharacterized membrane protein
MTRHRSSPFAAIRRRDHNGAMGAHLKKSFLAGIFAVIPIAVTAFVLWYVDQNTRILARKVLRVDVPFLGVVVALTLIYLLGLVITSLLGRFFIKLLDRVLSRLPVLKEVYKIWKQVALSPGEGIFAKVVLVPCDTGKAIGFTSGQPVGDGLCVFIPAAPNPTSGRLILVKHADCTVLEISSEEAFKMILSSGSYLPAGLTTRERVAPAAADASQPVG